MNPILWGFSMPIFRLFWNWHWNNKQWMY